MPQPSSADASLSLLPGATDNHHLAKAIFLNAIPYALTRAFEMITNAYIFAVAAKSFGGSNLLLTVLGWISPFYYLIRGVGAVYQYPVGEKIRALVTASDNVNEGEQNDPAKVGVYYRSQVIISQGCGLGAATMVMIGMFIINYGYHADIHLAPTITPHTANATINYDANLPAQVVGFSGAMAVALPLMYLFNVMQMSIKAFNKSHVWGVFVITAAANLALVGIFKQLSQQNLFGFDGLATMGASFFCSNAIACVLGALYIFLFGLRNPKYQLNTWKVAGQKTERAALARLGVHFICYSASELVAGLITQTAFIGADTAVTAAQHSAQYLAMVLANIGFAIGISMMIVLAEYQDRAGDAKPYARRKKLFNAALLLSFLAPAVAIISFATAPEYVLHLIGAKQLSASTAMPYVMTSLVGQFADAFRHVSFLNAGYGKLPNDGDKFLAAQTNRKAALKLNVALMMIVNTLSAVLGKLTVPEVALVGRALTMFIGAILTRLIFNYHQFAQRIDNVLSFPSCRCR